jgi:hypothetical protein
MNSRKKLRYEEKEQDRQEEIDRNAAQREKSAERDRLQTQICRQTDRKTEERDRLQTQICRHTGRKIAERDRLKAQRCIDTQAGK